MIVRSPQRLSRQPRPIAEPGAENSGIAAYGACMAATEASLSSLLPSVVTPPSICRRGKGITSAAAGGVQPARAAAPRQAPTPARGAPAGVTPGGPLLVGS